MQVMQCTGRMSGIRNPAGNAKSYGNRTGHFYTRKGCCMNSFLRRYMFAVARRIVPSVKKRYRLEQMCGPLGYWDQIQQYQLHFLMQMGLKPHHTLLDIGCGPLSGGLSFISYLDKGNYCGIDVRKEAITEGHIQIADTGLVDKNPFLAVSNTFGVEELGDRKFDYIFASQMLYHLNEDIIEALFKRLPLIMKPESKFYGDIIGYPNRVRESSHWHEFSFYLHSHAFLEGICEKYGLAISNLGQIEQFSYPDTVALKTNDMLEIRLAREALSDELMRNVANG